MGDVTSDTTADLIAELTANPHPALRRLREQGPIIWVPELNGWVVTTRDVAVEVMRDDATFTVDDPRFSTARVVGRSMLSTDGEEHARHRAPFAPPFRRRIVADGFAAWIRQAATEGVSSLVPNGSAELRSSLAAPLAVDAIIHLLGIEAEPADVLSWYRAIVAEVQSISAGLEPSGQGERAFQDLRRAVIESVSESAPGPGDSLLSIAAAALSEDEVASNAAVLMFGAIETSEGAATNALYHLLSHPLQLAAVTADVSLVPNAVEESLRLEPAAASVDRYATVDVQLGGVTIRRGDYVIVSLAAANRDPSVFPKPDRFDIRRSNAPLHVTFAQGPHYCLGLHAARLETIAVVEACVALLSNVRLDTAATSPPVGLVFRKPEQLMVAWDVAG